MVTPDRDEIGGIDVISSLGTIYVANYGNDSVSLFYTTAILPVI